MIDPQLPGAWKLWTASFSTTNAALAKILADVTPGEVQAAITNENPVPGEQAVRQRVLTGGQRIFDGGIASTDGTNRSGVLYLGRQTSLFVNMGTVSTSGTNALNRSTGSFITDGYRIGDACMFFGTLGVGIPTAANEGIQNLVVTGVTATVLTFSGTLLTSESMAAGFRVFRVARLTQRQVPLNAGNGDALPCVQLLGGSQQPQAFAAPDTGLSLGADEALIVAMTAAISALPAHVDWHAIAARY